MDPRATRIVVGLAVEKAYFERPESIPKLAVLWEEPMREAIQRAVDELLRSNEIWERVVAFRLQAAIQGDNADPDPIAWRDLALDIMDVVPNLVDFMYRVGGFADQELDKTNKQILNDAYNILRQWQGSLNECVDEMRKENWTEAKVKIEQARDISTAPNFIGLLTLYKDLKMPVEGYRERTLRFHERVTAFPSKLDIPSQRIDVILATLSIQLKLCELHHRYFQDRAIEDACGYAVQTVGQTLDYLLSVDDRMNAAKNELSLAILHLKGTVKAVKNTEIRSQLEQIHDELLRLPLT